MKRYNTFKIKKQKKKKIYIYKIKSSFLGMNVVIKKNRTELGHSKFWCSKPTFLFENHL